MNNEIATIIKDRIDKLPTNVATAIRSVPWIETMQNIAKINQLDKEKMGLFEIETVLAVLGIIPPMEYPNNLAQNVGLLDSTVIKIAKEVDDQIIAPILKIIEKNETGPTENKASIANNKNATSLGTKDKNKIISVIKPSVPELVPDIHPMVEKGEVAHDVAHVEPTTDNKQPTKEEVKLPDYRYPGGKDPYRETT